MKKNCKNLSCLKEFGVIENRLGCAGCKEKEEVKCPYCNNLYEERMTTGWFITYKIEDCIGGNKRVQR